MSTSVFPTIALSRKEFSQLTGLSVPFVDILIRDGRLRVTRLGARVLVPRSEVLRIAGESTK